MYIYICIYRVTLMFLSPSPTHLTPPPPHPTPRAPPQVHDISAGLNIRLLQACVTALRTLLLLRTGSGVNPNPNPSGVKGNPIPNPCPPGLRVTLTPNPCPPRYTIFRPA